MGHVKIILGILIGLFVAIIAVQNNEAMSRKVQLRVNPVIMEERKSGEISLYQLVLVSFVVGVLGTGLHGMVERFRLKRRIRSLTRELQDKDKELSSLRNLPLTYDPVGSINCEGAGPKQGEGA
jgi:hypothetical protein